MNTRELDDKQLPEYIEGLPNICGHEDLIARTIATAAGTTVYPIPVEPFAGVDSAFALALHMHQPLIPAGGEDLRSAEIIGHLQYMAEHEYIHDNHNHTAFRWCYKRMSEFVPQLVQDGADPRIMLEYSGTLLHGLRQMGAGDVLDALCDTARDPRYRDKIEWLGCPWGHAVAPSTPVQDYRLHVRAWQHHFAALFGLEMLARVRGFSPSEMALPNHPDVAYEFVRTLLDCGYQWVLVQEHTVELLDGSPLTDHHLPHRLTTTNTHGQTASIVALIKTQGSDTKIIAQMQPYDEARWLPRAQLAGRGIPQLVTQISDGENGGVMMNEFPPKYLEVIKRCSHTATPILNGTEYLERLYATGVTPSDLKAIQPRWQHRIWQRITPGDGPSRLAELAKELHEEDHRFHMEGGSWTNGISWVRGYDSLLIPMERASADFQTNVIAPGVPTNSPDYRRALFCLVCAETSCFRYWGQGPWTARGAELARRAGEAIAAIGSRGYVPTTPAVPPAIP